MFLEKENKILKIKQTNLFLKQKKKLHANQIAFLDLAIKNISNNPKMGESKKGDLESILVYKFQMANQEYLLAYHCLKDTITLLSVGMHENFYRNLKRIKEIESEYI